MLTLKETFFEDPLFVYIALGLAELVVLSAWHYSRNIKWAKAAAVPIVLAGAAFAVSRLVVTDRERIIASAGQIAAGLSEGDTMAVEKYLHKDFASRRWDDRDRAVAAAERALEDYGLRRVKVYRMNVQVSNDRAEMHANTIVEYAGGLGVGKASLFWHIVWERSGKKWKIIRVTNVHPAIGF